MYDDLLADMLNLHGDYTQNSCDSLVMDIEANVLNPLISELSGLCQTQDAAERAEARIDNLLAEIQSMEPINE